MKRLAPRDYAQALVSAYTAVKPDEHSSVIKNFLQLLRRQRASNLLPRILEHLQHLDDQAHQRTRVHITSAQHVDQSDLSKRLSNILGSVVLQTALDPSLIGGLTIRVRDELVDSSIRGRLHRLQTHLNSSHA